MLLRRVRVRGNEKAAAKEAAGTGSKKRQQEKAIVGNRQEEAAAASGSPCIHGTDAEDLRAHCIQRRGEVSPGPGNRVARRAHEDGGGRRGDLAEHIHIRVVVSDHLYTRRLPRSTRQLFWRREHKARAQGESTGRRKARSGDRCEWQPHPRKDRGVLSRVCEASPRSEPLGTYSDLEARSLHTRRGCDGGVRIAACSKGRAKGG